MTKLFDVWIHYVDLHIVYDEHFLLALVFIVVMTTVCTWSCVFIVVMNAMCTWSCVFVVVMTTVCLSRVGCSQEVSSSECPATRPSRQLFPSVRLQVNVCVPVQPGIHTATNGHSLGHLCHSGWGWRGVGQITLSLRRFVS